MKKTFCRFFTIADFIEEENWLREQHKKGLKLVKTTAPCFFTFEECEPEDVIYRLDFKNNKAENDYKQMYQEYGWEYFNTCVGWHYFRKPASQITQQSEGQLFSDNESKLSMVEHIIKTRMLPLVCIFCCCVIPNMTRLSHGTHGAVDKGLSLVFYFLFALYMFIFLHCGRKLRKMKSDLSK